MSSSNQNRYLASKKAEFHELFFDLIFVYAIQKIAHVILHVDHGTISSVWILWAHQTFLLTDLVN